MNSSAHDDDNRTILSIRHEDLQWRLRLSFRNRIDTVASRYFGRSASDDGEAPEFLTNQI